MQNDLYLDEIQDIIMRTTGKTLSIPTVWRTLNSMGITNKAVCIPLTYTTCIDILKIKQLTRSAAERSPLKRAAYILEIGQYDSQQLVFLGKCYIDKQSTARLQGWSHRGTRATSQTPFLCGAWYAFIIPAH